MKYDYMERATRSQLIKDYEDFFWVLKNHLGGVIQLKFSNYFLSHSSDIFGMMMDVGLLKKFYMNGMVVFQLQYSNELSSHNVGKVTRDMLLRSALRMEQYKKAGLKTFAEIKEYGMRGNNYSANINQQVLERYDVGLNKKGILIEDLTSKETLSILYQLKSQNIFIDCVKVKGRIIKPHISIYNINIEKPKKMAGRIAFAHNQIVSIFTDYITGTEVQPTITIHEFGDMELFNNLTYQELLKSHYNDMGCYDLEMLCNKVIFNVYENKSKTPYSNILN